MGSLVREALFTPMQGPDQVSKHYLFSIIVIKTTVAMPKCLCLEILILWLKWTNITFLLMS
jgi:hypothetical protein